MHQCTHCQVELLPSAQFCSHCGTPVEQEQNQSADAMSVDMEQQEERTQTEQEESQSPETSRNEAETAEDTATARENQLAETPQKQGEILAEQATDENKVAQEQSISDEAETDDETVIPPAEDTTEQGELATSVGNTSEDPDQQQDTQDKLALSIDQTQHEKIPSELPLSLARRNKVRPTTPLLIVILIVLVVLAGGGGAFALLSQHTSAGSASQCPGQQAGCAAITPGAGHANATRLTLSGAISGSMTVNAQVRCQSTATNNLRTLTITLSGVIGSQLYNFGFAINAYHGPGTYNNTPPSLTILLDVPGEATNNGWGNAAPTDTGSITIARGEQTGSITYLLSGFGSQAGTQVQISGNWTCD